MNYKQMKWFSFVTATLSIIVLEYIRHATWYQWLPKLLDSIIFVIILGSAIYFFNHYVYSKISNLVKENRKREAERSALYEQAVDAIIFFDENYRIIDLNPAAKKLLGLSYEKAVMKTCCNIFFCNQKDEKCNSHCNNCLRTYFEKSSIKTRELKIKTEKGLLPVSVSFSLIEGRSENTKLFVTIIRDLSEQKRLQSELIQRRKEAEAQLRISQALSSLKEITFQKPSSPLTEVLLQLMNTYQADVAGIAKLNQKCEFIQWQNIRGFKTIKISPLIITNRLKNLLEKNKPFELIETNKDDYLKGYTTVHIVPLMIQKETYGLLVVGYRLKKQYTPAQRMGVMIVSKQLSIAIENVQLYQKMQQIAILEERERLAREMHDGLAQSIGALHMKVQLLQYHTSRKDYEKISVVIDQMKNYVDEAYQDVRQNLFSLKNSIATKSFLQTLKEYLTLFFDQNQISIRFNSHLELEPMLNAAVELQLIRIIQEALTNVRKHAMTDEVFLTLWEEQSYVYARIQDFGIGFDTQSENRTNNQFGLLIMHERAEAVGGEVQIFSELQKGTTVDVKIPKIEQQKGELEHEQIENSAL